MPTLNSAKDFLYNAPVEVYFAGFKSDTFTLGRSGWDLSLQEGWSPRGPDYELRLALRHEGARLYAITNSINLRASELYSAATEKLRTYQHLVSIPFHVQVIGNSIEFRHVQSIMSSGLMRDSFQPINSVPEMGELTENIRDFKFFKTINPTMKDIVVDPSQVPELLDMILKVQRPTQEQIRKREKSRENLEWMRNGFEVKPAHQVQAQIITLAG